MPKNKPKKMSKAAAREAAENRMEELEDAIRTGDRNMLIGKLEELTPEDIMLIPTEFASNNPLLLAMELEEEEMCIYIIEKGLSGLKEGSDIQSLRNENPERNIWDYAAGLPKVQQWMYEIVTGKRQAGARKVGVHLGLERLIKKGQMLLIKNLLLKVKKVEDARKIEEDFEYRDPVHIAVQHGHEDIAVFLIEMGFKYDKEHKQVGLPGTEDEWPVHSTLRAAQDLPKVKQLIDDINAGKRELGDALKPKKKVEPPRKPENPKVTRHKELARKLQELIAKNDIRAIEKLLESSDQDMIYGISTHYKQDPVLQAVQAKHEDIAIFLVEKGFSFTTPEFMDGKKFTPVDIALNNNLLNFHQLTEDINSGVRRPGDGLQSAWHTLARELQKGILTGDSREVRKVLDNFTDDEQIKRIEKQFPDRDPVIFAIDNREEYIALYLIEKGFSFAKWYTWPGERCDQWCYSEHQGGPCPAEYRALELATKKDLPHVISLIQNIQSGARKPGDGLPELQDPVLPTKSAPEKVHDTKGVATSDSSLYQTKTSAARVKAEKLGCAYMNKNGDNLMHLAVEEGPELVYVSAKMEVPVNKQNFDGNTALHLAVHRGKLAVAKALLISGADISIRNKLGQSPMDCSRGPIKKLLENFKPGLVKAVQNSEGSSLQRLLKMWVNPHSIIKEGKSALDIVSVGKNNTKDMQKCDGLLRHHLKNLELVHAVLSEDIDSLKSMLRGDTQGKININIRFMGKKGESPLSCAIAQKNLEIVQLLVETGRCHCNIRVPESEGSDATVPVIFKALESNCVIDMWKFLKEHCRQSSEKDSHGNTPFLRAIACGRSASFIADMIKYDGGFCLCDRNKDGMLPRDLAVDLNKPDIVDEIDKFILNSPGQYFLKYLPQNFYGQANIDIKNQSGQSLLDLAVRSKKDEDIMAVRAYAKLEELCTRLFSAAQMGDIKAVAELNTMSFRDQNGYNALHKAVAFEQLRVAEVLITSRPGLKSMGDNSNRYPLHYAYAMPEDVGQPFVKLLLQRDPEKTEHLVDKDGREPAEYKDLRESADVIKMMIDIHALDPHGKPTQL